MARKKVNSLHAIKPAPDPKISREFYTEGKRKLESDREKERGKKEEEIFTYFIKLNLIYRNLFSIRLVFYLKDFDGGIRRNAKIVVGKRDICVASYNAERLRTIFF